MASNEWCTYRHEVTGRVGVYPRSLGDNDPYLKEVKPNAKPLATALIPRKAKSGEATSSTTNNKRK